MKITKISKKQIFKIFVLLVMIGIACFLCKDSLIPVFVQVKETKISTIAMICIISLGYFVFEGINLWRLSLKYTPGFTMAQGVSCSFYACFYRTLTMGKCLVCSWYVLSE